jgi:cytochrome c oxidase assembly protein subunit 15
VTHSPPNHLTSASNRWPHRVAVALVGATFPLIWIGGLVTTYDAGMAVPDWPNTYGYNLFLYPLSTWLSGPWDLFIEHGHRLLAATVGLITIVLVVVTWWADSRMWVRQLTLCCLALVIVQGALGGLRVLLDATVLARLHGCVGPLFFVASVVAASVTSQTWLQATSRPASPVTATFLRLAWITAGIAYVQLILGAHLRHIPASWSPSVFRAVLLAHLLGAAVLTTHVAVLSVQAVSQPQIRRCNWVCRPTWTLAVLTLCQLLLGAASWRLKYGWPEGLPLPVRLRGFAITAEGMTQTIAVTAHVALGSLIVALTTLVAIRGSRRFTSAAGQNLLTHSARHLGVLI